MWTRSKADVEVAVTEWLAEWNLPPTERRDSRPFCSIHWAEGAEHRLLPTDKVFRRETQSRYERAIVYLLERDGKVVARAEEVLWKIVE